MAARQDLIDKYGLTKPDSWDNYVSYLKELAEKQGETGVTALNTNANREQLLTVYGQSKGVQGVTEGYDFEYYANNSDAAPTTDDIWYLYTSDFYKDYCNEMAELASAKVWSSDAINDTSDAQAYLKMVQVAHLYGIHLCLQQEKISKKHRLEHIQYMM